MNYRKEIVKSLNRLAYYERLSAQKQEAWDADPMNQDREAAADRAYELEFKEFIFAAQLISKFARIDEKAACAMIKGKRTELKWILTA